ncbi:MAG TPA: polysaccharide deacetylase family protein [Burkholderiales bacterium]|nr:polysaccharide deacetylase family protein [Burkholderiales bacterium]
MIKSIAYSVAAFAGAPRVFQRIFAPDGIAVLMYHAVVREPLPVSDWCFLEEKVFHDQMTYLKKHCRIVPLRELPASVQPKNGRPVAAVTFDDGYQNNYDVAFPILRQMEIPATIFLATDFIGSDDTVWFCRINEALAKTSLDGFDWEEATYDLSSMPKRVSASAEIQVRLKRYSHPRLLEKMRDLVRALGGNPEMPIARESPYRMLCASAIREMADSGLIDFGGHTCSHAILSGLDDSLREREISGSIDAVGRLTGAPCGLFAYPNGGAEDYGPRDVAALKRSNVAIAANTVAGPNDRSVPALELRRYGIGADTSMARFQLLTHHVLWALREKRADLRH